MKEVWDNDVKYRWVTSYYDMPLQGTCYYEDKLWRFQRSNKTDNMDEYYSEILELYPLTILEQLKWKLKQKWFEICVGEHLSHYTYKRNSKL
jgi:hypothetical protein